MSQKEIRIQIVSLSILLVIPRKICFQKPVINYVVIMNLIILHDDVCIGINLPLMTPYDAVAFMTVVGPFLIPLLLYKFHK